jgi:hypothetical protein
MRLWTVHPKYLDACGLVAVWREGLLAQKVLEARTRGYRNHPQLIRFREQPDPLGAISMFLLGITDEARKRGYRFDVSKISERRLTEQISETTGQLLYEWKHLESKLSARAPALAQQFRKIKIPDPHPLFCLCDGEIKIWEKR